MRPALTLETGFAYGVSVLFLAEDLRQNGAGRHLAIDPFASSRFDGLGRMHLEEAGLAPLEERVRVDFAFVDGHHLFDHVVTECLFLGTLRPRGGLLVIDDVNLPAVERACDFFAANRADFEEITETKRPGVLQRLFRATFPPTFVAPFPADRRRGRPRLEPFRPILTKARLLPAGPRPVM